MGHFEYIDAKVFKDPESIDYEDSRFGFKGQLLSASLYGMSDSEQIASQIIAPTLSLFRQLE